MKQVPEAISIRLCPRQQREYEHLRSLMPIGSIFVLSGDAGMGKTTVLEKLHSDLGGALLNGRDFIEAIRDRHPFTMEEALDRLLRETLQAHDLVIVDELSLITAPMENYEYPRKGVVDIVLSRIASEAMAEGKQLVFATSCGVPDALDGRSYQASITSFDEPDYEFLARSYLRPELADRLDFGRIYRFTPGLNGHQLRGACTQLNLDAALDTDTFIDYLRTHHMHSNVHLGEVQDVDLRDLKGLDDVIESLEMNIVLPLENDHLAAELGLKPKRGVLLAGPPGTGKTTIGRALAHRLKSKFFLVDGTFISGTDDFYDRIKRVFQHAKLNAPSIIFIDDSDVIFENGEESGLYRYLLTMLDGLESASAGRVCVMMTAMEVGNLPPALMRSGRVELWLETRLPDHAARVEILTAKLGDLMERIGDVDVVRLATEAEEFTGADLKRLVEDGKLLYAADRARDAKMRPATEYFDDALKNILRLKLWYADAEARAREARPNRPPWFDVATAIASGATSRMYTTFRPDSGEN